VAPRVLTGDVLQRIDRVERIELLQAPRCRVSQPLDLAACVQTLKDRTRRLAIASARQRHRGHRLQPVRRTGYLCRLPEPLAGEAKVPVAEMDEGDVVRVFPPLLPCPHPLFEQAHRQIGSAGARRRGLRQEVGAKPVCDAEIRIE
jgi:hypothetical protein